MLSLGFRASVGVGVSFDYHRRLTPTLRPTPNTYTNTRINTKLETTQCLEQPLSGGVGVGSSGGWLMGG